MDQASDLRVIRLLTDNRFSAGTEGDEALRQWHAHLEFVSEIESLDAPAEGALGLRSQSEERLSL
ncbi:hypothetical protein AA309_27480 [Microvirga vignae]|uniref:Uncharacterized protein n=1 Tax=Microvirga vignae TaxID=1225564 RepID=A0A0H1R4Y3_9HYPH|nr:hypothetical protein AA309_27480 [Microvirga vignae]